MKEEIYTLDGTECAVVPIEKVIQNGKKYYLRHSVEKKYRNSRLLKVEMDMLGIKNYDIGFDLNGDIYSISMFQETQKGLYQGFINDDIITVIPTIHEEVVKCGYILFYDNPYEKINNCKDGSEINKTVYKVMRECSTDLLRSGFFESTIKDTSMVYLSSINIAPFKYNYSDSTLSLRYMRWFELQKINVIRKNCNDFVLPFSTEVDKYKTIYYCFTKDKHEHCVEQEKYINDINNTLKTIISFISNKYPELTPNILDIPVWRPINL